jgi:hypothetical protein
VKSSPHRSNTPARMGGGPMEVLSIAGTDERGRRAQPVTGRGGGPRAPSPTIGKWQLVPTATGTAPECHFLIN